MGVAVDKKKPDFALIHPAGTCATAVQSSLRFPSRRGEMPTGEGGAAGARGPGSRLPPASASAARPLLGRARPLAAGPAPPRPAPPHPSPTPCHRAPLRPGSPLLQLSPPRAPAPSIQAAQEVTVLTEQARWRPWGSSKVVSALPGQGAKRRGAEFKDLGAGEMGAPRRGMHLPQGHAGGCTCRRDAAPGRASVQRVWGTRAAPSSALPTPRFAVEA